MLYEWKRMIFEMKLNKLMAWTILNLFFISAKSKTNKKSNQLLWFPYPHIIHNRQLKNTSFSTFDSLPNPPKQPTSAINKKSRAAPDINNAPKLAGRKKKATTNNDTSENYISPAARGLSSGKSTRGARSFLQAKSQVRSLIRNSRELAQQALSCASRTSN